MTSATGQQRPAKRRQSPQTRRPDFMLEDGTPGIVCGVDEVGRGPLAGPVVAAAVYIPRDRFCSSLAVNLNDSKLIAPQKREQLAAAIHDSPAIAAIASASVEEIDRLNILQATFLAMQRAVEELCRKLGEPPALALVDGNRTPGALPCPARAVVKGDSISLSIAASSIIAKTYRDKLMKNLANDCPGYGWERNAGYGTAEHLQAIDNLGVTAHHRLSFEPILQRTSVKH